jgi:hypothetical protein
MLSADFSNKRACMKCVKHACADEPSRYLNILSVLLAIRWVPLWLFTQLRMTVIPPAAPLSNSRFEYPAMMPSTPATPSSLST